MELASGQVTDRPWGQTLGALGRRKLDGQLTLLTSDGKQYQVAFEGGAVVGATSPLTMDSVVRVALKSHLITSSQVSQAVQAIAANPYFDELDVLFAALRLDAEQGLRLRQRVIAQRAARTFAVESGYFIVDETVTIPVVHAAAVDIRAIVYLGVRMNLSEHRLAMDLRQLGSHFVLKPEAIADVMQYGLSSTELPIVDALQGGATVPELEARHRDIDPRSMRSVIYALVSCFACDATPTEDGDVPEFQPIVPRTSSTDGVFIKPVLRATAMGSSSIPRTTTAQLAARTTTSEPAVPRTPTGPQRPRTPSDPVRSRIPYDDDIAKPRVATPNRPSASRTVTRQILDSQPTIARTPSPTQPPASRTASPTQPPTSRTASPTAPPASRTASPTAPPASRTASPTTPPVSRTPSPTTPPVSRTPSPHPTASRPPSQQIPTVSRTSSRTVITRAPSPQPSVGRTPSDRLPAPVPEGEAPTASRTITSRGIADDPNALDRQGALALAAEAYQRGQAALRDDQIPLAIEELTRAAELNPHEFDYHAMLAWAQFCGSTDRVKIADKARKMLNHAIQKSKNPELARFYLGRMERMLGRDREALRHFQRVLEEQPRNTDAASEIRSLEARLASGSAEKPGLSSLFGRKKT